MVLELILRLRVSKGESKAAKNYNELAQDFPNIHKIIKNEENHAEIERGFISKNFFVKEINFMLTGKTIKYKIRLEIKLSTIEF